LLVVALCVPARDDNFAPGNAVWVGSGSFLCSLLLQIVENGASLRLTDMGNGGSHALDRSYDAVRGDQFLLARPRRLSVSHSPAVWIAAALEGAGIEFTNGEQPGVRLKRALGQ
jgi:hypothetical protein